MSLIAKTPAPPYYAVIFSSVKKQPAQGYGEMADKMLDMAQQQPGFLGAESAREELGITVSYWQTLDDIKHWKQNADHVIAQQLGRETWYSEYKTRIAKVERDYQFADN